jgi:hypothetical protein
MNKQIILNALRKELHEQEDNLLFHKAEIAYMWDLCDPAKKNNPYVEQAFYRLNYHKEQARQIKRKLKNLREALKTIKVTVGILHV